jgi:hypothetical protein
MDGNDARALVGGDVGRMRGLEATALRGSGREYQGDSQMSQDLHPTGINVYGYAVAWVPAGATTWQMEPDDEFRNLPAHYPTLAEACDRVAYLKERGFKARAMALVVMAGDSAEEFEANKIAQE